MTRRVDQRDMEIKKDKVHTGCLVFAWCRTFHVFVVGLLYIDNSSHRHIPPGALGSVSISDTDPTHFFTIILCFLHSQTRKSFVNYSRQRQRLKCRCAEMS